MFLAFIQLFGFGKKPPQAEAAPMSPHPSDPLKEQSSQREEKAALPISSTTRSKSLDGSSEEFEDVRSFALPLCLRLIALLEANPSPGNLYLPGRCSALHYERQTLHNGTV